MSNFHGLLNLCAFVSFPPVLSASMGVGIGGGGAFDSLISLETLNLSANNIRKIGDDDLASLASATKLRTLDLSDNRISTLSAFAFAKLYSLKVCSRKVDGDCLVLMR